MRMGIRKDVDWEYLGALLAQSGDEEQVIFLKAFVKECNSWGTNQQVESQLATINLGLSVDEIETLSMITFVSDT